VRTHGRHVETSNLGLDAAPTSNSMRAQDFSSNYKFEVAIDQPDQYFWRELQSAGNNNDNRICNIFL